MFSLGNMPGWVTGLAVAGAVAGAAVVIWPLAVWLEVRSLEKPKYTIVRYLGSVKSFWTGKPIIELRKYAPYIIAETRVEANEFRPAANIGFRRVAGYIFGKNAGENEKIAMTSPVRMQPEPGHKIAMTSPVRMENTGFGSGSFSLSFVLPSKYTLSTLPRPLDDSVKLTEVPGHMAAALLFTGKMPCVAVIDQKAKELLEVLKSEGLEVEGPVKVYQYYPPWTPRWMRHQEVLFNIKE